ncbi:MAG: type II CRISPR RNA-guided endonuclease Cas9 [Bacteroidetes bacterium]|uniref:CRISPR-associated endonuclease Cas9 n=1 Tax=Candidatus Pullibacteroides excrementavium TaxID=2840905 RepID=A0A9D9DW68_9BACT|nr:type II CRISPR RNA-guided endonuclease Cas9 [Candidatus Pullibacteroides excrementavium]
MKKILGLDLGTTSIGWAVVNEAETATEQSSIIDLGVRIVPLTVDEQGNFEKGKAITTNADRTLKRSMRRNLFRYRLRRDALIRLLQEQGWITSQTVLAEKGNATTFQTIRLRAKAATEEVSLEEFARILLMINKKRGYKSNRKTDKSEAEEGSLVDSMSVAQELFDKGLTPGEYANDLLQKGKTLIPDFYRSDLESEFEKVWFVQSAFYPDLLTAELKETLKGKTEAQTWILCQKAFAIVGEKRKGTRQELLKENYAWRAEAVKNKVSLEQLAVVLQKINAQLKNVSGYLGKISDRSKELFFKNQTIGQYQWECLQKNPHYSFKNQVFYRRDYWDEFEKLWEVQSHFHPELTPELRRRLRDSVIFYQRPLRSQKSLISVCELEGRTIKIMVDGKVKQKTVGPKVCPKSSPLYQEFKIWQVLNNLTVNGRFLEQEQKDLLFKELNIKEKLKKTEILKLLYPKAKGIELNYAEVEGNRTQAALFKAYAKIVEATGHGDCDLAKMDADAIMGKVEPVFSAFGYNTGILHFDAEAGLDLDAKKQSSDKAEFSRQKSEDKAFEQQPLYRLWHLLYSFEGDNSKTGNDKLIQKIAELVGCEPEYAKYIASISFPDDYGSLSTKAMRRILPYMKEGHTYSLACEYAGYRHSKRSLTKEEIENKVLKDHLELLPRNSLRNPVVEKILNQMVHVVNGVVDKYGRLDEIRVELARELKKSAKERESLSSRIGESAKRHEQIREILERDFGIKNPSRNDIIRYKLYEELKDNGYKTLYSGTYVPKEQLFSPAFDIEHIIPQAKLFDDSFSNKTLESKQINIEKGHMTARDFIEKKYGDDGLEKYKAKVDSLLASGAISKTKRAHLLMAESEIPEDFIARDLRETQYIAKKAKEMLEEIVKTVVSTSGAITERLREDWQLVNVMQELNWDKYDALGQTEVIERRLGQKVHKIKDWSKRNDHRHHAMDALTVAFTKQTYIQYLNHLNARIQKDIDDSCPDLRAIDWSILPKEDYPVVIRWIQKTQLYKDKEGRYRFNPPMPLDMFRQEAKRHLSKVLISIKAKNKVATRNVNKTKKAGGFNKKVQLTPRGQLHNETIYGSMQRYESKLEKVGGTFDVAKIQTVASPIYRAALMDRLQQFGGDAKKAFTGKNSLDKNPVFVDEMHTRQVPVSVKTVRLVSVYTVRKEISPDLKVEKVVDPHIRALLQERLKSFGGDAKKAFSNLDENPIWLNKEKGICIKRVRITGVNVATALHDKRDMQGRLLLDGEGNTMPVDYVSTSNNHHVAIFRDAEGNCQEHIVSFFEAMDRIRQGLPVVDKDYNKDKGWAFLFTMKQNEYFVFPDTQTGFDPQDMDLTNPANYELISPHLFRVQKLTTKYYVFRHHLETTVEDVNALRDVTWKRIQSLGSIDQIVKVRVNHIGQIVAVGEY